MDGEEEGDDVEVEKDTLPDPERPRPQVGVKKKAKKGCDYFGPSENEQKS